MPQKNSFEKTIFYAVLVTLFTLMLYLLTLAPTVLWGDDAELQRLAILQDSGSGVRNYWLWGSIVHLFTKLPFGDLAWRVNLSSAVFAALTTGILFVIAFKILDFPVRIAGATSVVLAVSHTFWLHAVRAEVYTLFAFLLMGIIALLLAWHKNPSRWPLLTVSLLLTGVALWAHLLIITFIPAVFALVIVAKKTNAKRIYLIAFVSLMVSLLPYWIANQSGESQVNISSILSGFFEIGARDLALWLGFLGYQFLLFTPLGVLGLMNLWQTNRALLIFLVVAFLGNIIFALSFHVPDQYVFYLPSYLIFVLWIGVGLVSVYKRFAAKQQRLLMTLFVIAVLSQIAIYRVTPMVLNQLDLNLLSVRTLPNRDNNLFFLYPPKNGYYGAQMFGETVMESLPNNAAVLADWLPLQTLTYFQDVENMRQDVLLADTYVPDGQIIWLLEQSQTRPVFMADDESYYDIQEIAQKFEITPFGPIFILERRPE
ncbi:MAG: hypothetical protein CL608_29240 [Anaerolineaceae bacterium]|nr:hypothetical protein [Anaerolineaceae bacterium]